MQKRYDVFIIGGGIIGAAIAYQLGKYQLSFCLVEKNANFGLETSQGNSGVIHGGFDPKPGSLMAKLNLLGNQLWQKEIFPNLGFPYQKVDSLVIAFDQHEHQHLEKLYQWGIQNGLNPNDLQLLDQKELLRREPHINPQATSALLCTSSYVIDPTKATLAFLGASVNNGLTLKRSSEVTGISYDQATSLFQVELNHEQTIAAKTIINCAGHYADQVAKLAGYGEFELSTRRGEYLVLSQSELKKVNHVCFMVPTIHGKGVIVAPTLNQQVLVGPTAQDGVPKADTRLITQEKYQAILAIGNRIIPSLDLTRIEGRYSGSRPIDHATDDFLIKPATNNRAFINVAGIQSPGISSAPAIALMVADLLKESGLKLVEKTDFQPKFSVFY